MHLYRFSNIPYYETAPEVEMCMQSNDLSKIWIYLQNVDCKPKLDYSSSSTHLKSDLAKNVKTYQSVREDERKRIRQK